MIRSSGVDTANLSNTLLTSSNQQLHITYTCLIMRASTKEKTKQFIKHSNAVRKGLRLKAIELDDAIQRAVERERN